MNHLRIPCPGKLATLSSSTSKVASQFGCALVLIILEDFGLEHKQCEHFYKEIKDLIW